MKTIKICLFVLLFGCLVGCTQLNGDRSTNSDRLNSSAISVPSNLTEVASPKIIKTLNKDLTDYVPQVKIITPKAEQTFDRTEVMVTLEAENLPIFENSQSQVGNHLNLIVDNEPFQPIYSLDKPIIIKDLTPGTHTIRAFAVRPWGESYKNEGAYAQTTFNVLTQTNNNLIDPSQPLLTYNSPTGTYGAQPVLLDFYLTNAPLHAIAQNNPNVEDWRVRATVNGTSFTIEDWQPIYLKGFEPGENWVQLELIDRAGNNIENAFNNTVRVFTYDPQQDDTLAKLVTEQVTLAEAQSLIKPDDVTSEIIAGDSIESEPQNDVEPEIIADNLVDSVAKPEIITQTAPTDNEPSVSSASPADEDRIAAAQAALETNIIEPELEEKVIEPEVIEPSSDNKNTTPDSVVVDDSVKSELEAGTTETTVIISEASPEDREQPISTIVIPQPESVEVSEGEVAIVVPQTEPKPKADSSLWWKKILVDLRQKIEAIAKKLPNEI